MGYDYPHRHRPLTKTKLEFNAKNLNDFDAIFMFAGGDPEMDAQQKADSLSFIHDDGKGLDWRSRRGHRLGPLA